MARTHNAITVMGWLLRDPEIRYTKVGMPIARGGISAPRHFRTKAGVWVVDKCWIDFSVFGASSTRLVELCKKGDILLLAGWLKYEIWQDRHNNRRTSHAIMVKEWKFIMHGEDHTALFQRDELDYRGRSEREVRQDKKDEGKSPSEEL